MIAFLFSWCLILRDNKKNTSDYPDVRTFLGSGLVLLPLCFGLWCRPKKLPNTKQQLREKTHTHQTVNINYQKCS